jgi:hypothetical protein
VNLELPDEAVQFGATAEKALTALGGVDLARDAEREREPDIRLAKVGNAIDSLGADQLDPRVDIETAAAAGELCRVAGRLAIPYPVVAVLLRDPVDLLPFALVPDDRCRADHGDLFSEWRVAAPGGQQAVAMPVGSRFGSKLGPFVTDLTPTGEWQGTAPGDVALHLTLTSWRILGTTERSLELAIDHVGERVQFGQPLSAFQAVQFQLADAAVGTDGLRELCHFTLWRLFADPDAGLADALALRLHAVDTARAVLRTSQQLHGAAGLCDEYDVSVLARHVQPDLRLPFGSERTSAELVEAVSRLGFASLFPQGGLDP